MEQLLFICCCSKWTWTNCSNFIGKRKSKCWSCRWGYLLLLFDFFFFFFFFFHFLIFLFFFNVKERSNSSFYCCLKMDMNKLFKFYWKKENQMLILQHEVFFEIKKLISISEELIFFSFFFTFWTQTFLFFLIKRMEADSSLYCCLSRTWTNCSNFIGKRKTKCWSCKWRFFSFWLLFIILIISFHFSIGFFFECKEWGNPSFFFSFSYLFFFYPRNMEQLQLYIAAQKGHEQIVQLLLEKGNLKCWFSERFFFFFFSFFFEFLNMKENPFFFVMWKTNCSIEHWKNCFGWSCRSFLGWFFLFFFIFFFHFLFLYFFLNHVKSGTTPLYIAALKMDMNKLFKFYWKKEKQMLILQRTGFFYLFIFLYFSLFNLLFEK